MNLVERVDLQKVHYLKSLSFAQYKSAVNSSSKTDKDLRVLYDKLQNYCNELIKGKGEFKRTYHHTLKTPLEAGGRLFCGGSIQGQPRNIRGFLFGDTTTDIDMTNAHPVICRYICKKNNIDCQNLEYYITNRDDILDRFPDRETAKNAFLCALNDDKPCKKLDKYPKETIKVFKDFDKEIKVIQKKIIELDEYKHCVNCVPESKRYNFNGSAINRILCYEENKILQIIIDKLATKEIELCALMFDGCMPYGDYYDNEDLLNELSNEINSHEDYRDLLNIELKYKEHSNEIVIPDDFVSKTEIENINTFDDVAKDFEKDHCKIVSKSIFIKQYNNENIVMNRQALKTSYEHLIYKKSDKNGDIVNCNFINDWLVNNPNQRSYEDIGVYPNESLCPKNVFNMWRKFDMEYVTEYKEHQKGLDFMLNHIKVLCNKETVVFDYLVAWISQMIQYPEVKSICPTFISKEGSGKGSLMRLFEKMLGACKVFETTDPARDIWGDFNGSMANTFLINLNELSKKETLECEGKIKGLITDPKLTINNKGVNKYVIESHHRFIISTNNEEPINTTKDDRRKIIIRCSDELCGNKEYFDEMYNYLNDTDVIKTCYEYFKNYKIKTGTDDDDNDIMSDMRCFNKIPIPITEYQTELQSYSISPIEMWLKDWTEKYEDELQELEWTPTSLLESFNSWKHFNNIEYSVNSLKLCVRMSRLKIGGISKAHKKSGSITLFNVPQMRKHFGIGCLIEAE